MTAEEASGRALQFLRENGVSGVAIIRVDTIARGAGFLVFYQDERALAGDTKYSLLGNIPVVVSAVSGNACFSGNASNFRTFAEDWLARSK